MGLLWDGTLIRIAVATLLAAAAVAKSQAYSVDPIDAFGILDSSLARTLLVTIEIALAAALTLGFGGRVLIGGLLFLFSTFTIYAGVRWFEGIDHCGCLGKVVQPSTGLMVWVDLAVLTLLIAFRRSLLVARLVFSPALSALVVAVCMLAVALPVASARRLLGVSGTGEEMSVPFVAQSWVGKPLPLLPLFSTDVMRHGPWLVVLYRAGCGACDVEVPLLLKRIGDAGGKGVLGTRRVALVEIPPYPESDSPRYADAARAVGVDVARLEKLPVSWRIITPTALALDDSIVRRVASGTDVDSILYFGSIIGPRRKE